MRVLICFVTAAGVAVILGFGGHRYFGLSVAVSWVVSAVALSLFYELAKVVAFRKR
jgi:hypothetical protein